MTVTTLKYSALRLGSFFCYIELPILDWITNNKKSVSITISLEPLTNVTKLNFAPNILPIVTIMKQL